ncbi:MAG: L-threonylcarbamoyladenylate synthase [Leptospirales bacterium]|nr:L-threonylcarbamoyladenylate synthase [Leptospirales bacterium]
MILAIHEKNPQQRLVEQVCRVLNKGGIIIYPTDTVYAYGCDSANRQAIEQIYRLKKFNKKKPLSFIFQDISSINGYAKNVSNDAFKVMKKALPGPYTFIFNATKMVPAILGTNQKTVGVRIPDNKIAQALVASLGRPIMSASVNNMDGEYVIDPIELEKVYKNEVDIIIDSGPIISAPSTVVDFSGSFPEIIRHGKGEIFFM